jgi:hypothetical protein
MMKIQSINKKNTRNSIKKKKSQKSSPYYKENINHISSKYLSLLKGKRSSSKKRLEEKQLKPSNINTAQSKSTRSIISKHSPENNKSISKSFLKNQKTKKSTLVKDREIPKNSKNFKKPLNSQQLSSSSKILENGFRSPPLPKTFKTNQFKSIYNSTGKMNLSKQSKNKKQKISQIFYKTKDSLLVNKENDFEYNSTLLTLKNNTGVNEYCLNHPDKSSTFYLKLRLTTQIQNSFDKILQGYCSLCAVHLVKQGLECKEIMSEEERVRKQKIESFVEDLESEKENCAKTKKVLKLKMEDLKSNFETERDKINCYYSELYEKFEKNRVTYISDLESVFDQNKNKLNQQLKKYDETEQEFDYIYKDIKEHYEKIIKVIELEPFNNILDKYKETLNEYVNFSNKTENLEIIFSEIEIKKKIEQMVKEINPLIEMRFLKSLVIQKKEIDLTESMKSTENLKNSKNSKEEKSDVYVSFDENCQNSTSQFEEDHNSNGSSAKTAKYDQILQKISNSQKAQKIYYDNLLKFSDPLKQMEEDKKKDDCSSSSSDFEHQKVFEIVDDENDWEMKQTPDLGGEKTGPENFNNHLTNLNNHNFNHINVDINKNISNNLLPSETDENINLQLKCKKKLSFNN